MAASTDTEHRDHRHDDHRPHHYHHHYGRPVLQRPPQQQHHYAYKTVVKKQRPSAGGKKKSTGNRRRRLTHVLAGIVLGLFVGYTFGGSYDRLRLYAGCGSGGAGGGSDAGRSGVLRPLQSPRARVDEDDSGGAIPAAGGGGAGGPPESLLFVGVMTANRYLATRAAAVHSTWARRVPGRVMFYSSETSVRPPGAADLPLVRLPTVDDSYPPQKKSFLMLQHMWDNYGSAYEWFMRADDDVYVRPDRLAALLRSVDSRKPVFIGQAGRGNQEEFGLLSLEYDENFCMGGPGVIMSRETLARVVPHIKHCLKNLFTTHEDVELGRCVQKFAGVSCTWSYEMQTILYHNSSGRDAFTGNLKQKEVHRAITLHPVKQHSHMYRIHNYMKGLELQEIQQKKILLHRDVRSMMDQLNSAHPRPSNEFRLTGDSKQLFSSRPGSPNYLGDPDLLGLPPGLNKYRPRKVADVIKWDFISKAWYSDTDANPRRRIDSYTKEGLDDVVREVMDLINKFSKQRGRVIDFKEIFYGYQRVNPLYGVDYMLDMLLMYKKYRGKKMTVPVRRHAYLQQQFTGFEVREVLDGSEVKMKTQQQDAEAYDNDDDDAAGSPSRDIADNGMVRVEGPPAKRRPDSQAKTVHFVLPLFNRLTTFARFVDNYESVCLANDERVTLTVVPYGKATADGAAAEVAQLAARHPGARLTVLPDAGGPFARAAALHAGAVHAAGPPPDDLLFFVDVDMLWTAATVDRVRLNTVRGRTVYFPIVYSEYDPVVVYGRAAGSPNHFLVNQDTGYWRQYGFGIVSAYATDLAAAGGLDTSIRGWGNEDVDLYEKFVRSRTSTAVSVFRAADPDLVHVYHPVECDAGLPEPKARMCANTRFETYGNVDQFANIIYRNREAVYEFAARRLLNGSTAATRPPPLPVSVSVPRPRV
ncbi:LOW QUALITY PROTEIN: chondroitin sulfate synthase 1-like [Rhopalosiphum maidis]|uniref:LOW QUALITY PROTEIN: chondroitin sulfate synthase 1-like n=1 Tax=Rhopalosiphum maidis TaxID=43146 RepID=UPI000F00808A|nr:LOW QUALITY PROTEIN: chondroitin sulfate synthase 1-like [Rhopalosiphum maidis]